MDPTEVSSEELYRQMANDIIEYLMDNNNSYRYIKFFDRTPEEIYDALTTDSLCIATMENPQNDAEEGSYLFFGDIEIQFLKLVPNERIELLWKLQTWPDSFFSRADIIIEKDDFTRVEVRFRGLPTSIEESEIIWEQEVWRPIIDAFAYKDDLMIWAESLE